ncbi:hypothetical protein BJX63DRAFT_415677 [Aspergillus granulosus]|uniref:Uncharacterized protein n=1 Tax=Aspergillus granulosus TaxID=176169 RepID=A0ABR4GT11_9EURO
MQFAECTEREIAEPKAMPWCQSSQAGWGLLAEFFNSLQYTAACADLLPVTQRYHSCSASSVNTGLKEIIYQRNLVLCAWSYSAAIVSLLPFTEVDGRKESQGEILPLKL